jgi:hypothetical protein
MTDYSTFNAVSSNTSTYGSINSGNNANIFDLAHNDLQSFTNASHHHFSQFYNQTQNVYNQLTTDSFAQHHQIPNSGSYKSLAHYNGMSTSNSWKNFSVQNSTSSASSSPHIEPNNNTDNNQCLQAQSNNFHPGKSLWIFLFSAF